MISTLFHAAFYNPIYNALVAIVALVPGGDVGVAVILITIAIRLILLPLSLKTARAQRTMKTLEPKIKEIKEKHKGDKEKEALDTWALYKEARVNPFSGFFILLVQIPVLLALYWVFAYEPFSAIDTMKLYSFTPTPGHVSMEFLGILSVSGKSILLAVLAGATQFLQAYFMLKGNTPVTGGGMQGDFQKIMGVQLKYVFPILMGVISYTTSGAVALYFITTNLFGALQEWYVARKHGPNSPPNQTNAILTTGSIVG